MQIGELIRRLRIERGWEQLDLSSRSGVDQPAISRLERTSDAFQDKDDLAKVAAALDLSTEEVRALAERETDADYFQRLEERIKRLEEKEPGPLQWWLRVRERLSEEEAQPPPGKTGAGPSIAGRRPPARRKSP